MKYLRCGEVLKLMSASCDGMLRDDDVRALNDHLMVCPGCREASRLLALGTRSLEEGASGTSPGFTCRVMAAARQWDAAGRRDVQALRISRIAVAAAVALLLVAVVPLIRGVVHRANGVSVHFEVAVPEAGEVALVGDFNDWKVGACPLRRKNGVWSVELRLPAGRYQYSFVVDGKVWLLDPRAGISVDNGYGGRNSVLDLSGAA